MKGFLGDMNEHFDIKKVVNEFEEFLTKYYSYFDYIKNEAGFEIDELSFFVPDSISWDKITEYYKLQQIESYYRNAKKFKEQYLYEAIELIFDEFENYSGQKIEWVREALFKKVLTKNYEKNWDNKLYGNLVHELVEHGSSQKNSIEFVAAISGVTATVIRDAYYETKKLVKKFNVYPLGRSPLDKIDSYLKQYDTVVSSVKKNPRYSKSANALAELQIKIEKYKLHFEQNMKKVLKDLERLKEPIA